LARAIVAFGWSSPIEVLDGDEFANFTKRSSRLKIAFRNTANAIGNLKEGWLVDFFKRINYKKGRATAVTAIART
jgi:hypothetical protein